MLGFFTAVGWLPSVAVWCWSPAEYSLSFCGLSDHRFGDHRLWLLAIAGLTAPAVAVKLHYPNFADVCECAVHNDMGMFSCDPWCRGTWLSQCTSNTTLPQWDHWRIQGKLWAIPYRSKTPLFATPCWRQAGDFLCFLLGHLELDSVFFLVWSSSILF